jgi:hypothetical protein
MNTIAKAAIIVAGIFLVLYFFGTQPPPAAPVPVSQVDQYGLVEQTPEQKEAIAQGIPEYAAAWNDQPKERQIYRISAEELHLKYDRNEVAEQQEIGNARVEVEGTIKSIDMDFTGDPVINLATTNQFESVTLSFAGSDKQQIAKLAKGQRVLVRCEKMTRIIGSPAGGHCTLLE